MARTMSTKKVKMSDMRVGLRIIFEYCSTYKKIFLTILISVFILALLQALRPIVFGNFLDAIVSPEKKTFLGVGIQLAFLWIIAYGALRVFRTIFKWLGDRLSRLLMVKVIRDHRVHSMEKLLEYPVSYFKTKKGGEIHEVISRANGSLSSIIGFNAPYFSVELIAVLLAIAIAFTISPLLASILLSGVLVFLVLMKLVTPKIQVAIKRVNTELNKVKSDYFEIITNIFEVKRNTTEKPELKKVSKGYGGGFYNASVNEQNIWVDNNALRNIIVFGTEISIFVVSVFLVQKSMITIGEVVAINLYAQQTFMPLVRLSDMWLYLTGAVVKIKEGEELLEGEKEPKVKKNKNTPKELSGKIEFKDVRFRYQADEQEILKGVSFTAEPGKTIALVGESGVGKSTTIELVGGFYFAQQGDVLLDDISITELPLEVVRKDIGYVSQEVTLFNDTVYNNVAYGANRKVTKEEVYAACKQARADVFIKTFDKGYKQLVGERGVKLSVGQKQRIAIARTILRNPKILILDEPTSALDSKTEKYITTALKKLMKGRTTFVIAHRLSTVRDADTILVYQSGKITERGSHKELMKLNKVYARMYKDHIGLD